MHCSAQEYYGKEHFSSRAPDTTALATIHMCVTIKDTIEAILNDKNSEWFKKVFHYVIRLEYQQRGTIHFHVAVWC